MNKIKVRTFFLVLIGLFLFLSTSRTSPAFAQQKVTCDACGYCKESKGIKLQIPQNWEQCRKCLYPSIGESSPESNKTIEIDATTKIPPAPRTGRYFTMIGCIKTDVGGFTGGGAALSLVQPLLNLIFGTVGIISTFYIFYASFILITSQDRAERVDYGKRLLQSAIIGLIFTLSAVFILNLIANQVLKIPGFSS